MHLLLHTRALIICRFLCVSLYSFISQGGLIEQGLLQHQGDLTVIEGRFSSSRRRVFLFENMIIVAKKNKVAKGSTETFTYKESYKVWLSASDDEFIMFYSL